MRIRLTRHAEERLRERGISLEEVKVCIQNPDYTEESRGALRCWKRMGDKYIVVVYRVECNQWIVITAYKTSRRPRLPGRQ
ncbi:hypothetical protein Pyrfu_0321 [Pyrolobus fumarii 1A]|uniref:DUF4258 domain-containing protein n=1 Tax=Pyrolobus fumarii (strain DSM 11204 / 1A) TaxID=694429 RepID=G0EFM2_PYRF1|nr:DUF4258 domain-containing protein [Pyrolobus fumarii]AEM38193.1 hypothetical protein Pyrfu_0321 [Pyrolobus fumarii 1A]